MTWRSRATPAAACPSITVTWIWAVLTPGRDRCLHGRALSEPVDIPQGATITSAYIQFIADRTTERGHHPTDLLIEARPATMRRPLTTTANYISGHAPDHGPGCDLERLPCLDGRRPTTSTERHRHHRAGDRQPARLGLGQCRGSSAFSGSGYREAYACEGYPASARAPVLRVLLRRRPDSPSAIMAISARTTSTPTAATHSDYGL